MPDVPSVWCPITLCEVVWDAMASGAAPVVTRQLGLPWLGTAAVLSELHPFSQLLPSPLQHFTPLRDVICSAVASGAALVVALYGSRLPSTPYVITPAAGS